MPEKQHRQYLIIQERKVVSVRNRVCKSHAKNTVRPGMTLTTEGTMADGHDVEIAIVSNFSLSQESQERKLRDQPKKVIRRV